MKFPIFALLRQNLRPVLNFLQDIDLGKPSVLPSLPSLTTIEWGLADARYQAGRIMAVSKFFLLMGFLALVSAISFNLWQINHSITDENGLLEDLQAVLLMAAVAAHSFLAYREKDPALRTMRIAIALFCWCLCTREVDIDKLGTAELWKPIEQLTRAFTVLIIFSVILRSLQQIKILWASATKLFATPAILMMLFGCAVYAGGWPFDKELVQIDKGISVLLEETLELNACLLFLLAACARLKK